VRELFSPGLIPSPREVRLSFATDPLKDNSNDEEVKLSRQFLSKSVEHLEIDVGGGHAGDHRQTLEDLEYICSGLKALTVSGVQSNADSDVIARRFGRSGTIRTFTHEGALTRLLLSRVMKYRGLEELTLRPTSVENRCFPKIQRKLKIFCSLVVFDCKIALAHVRDLLQVLVVVMGLEEFYLDVPDRTEFDSVFPWVTQNINSPKLRRLEVSVGTGATFFEWGDGARFFGVMHNFSFDFLRQYPRLEWFAMFCMEPLEILPATVTAWTQAGLHQLVVLDFSRCQVHTTPRAMRELRASVEDVRCSQWKVPV
jgi:hypothetical protein